MKQTKRVLVMLLCAALIFTLAACGKSNNSSPADLTTAPYDAQQSGKIKIAALRDASAVALFAFYTDLYEETYHFGDRYEVTFAETSEDVLSQLAAGTVDAATLPVGAAKDDAAVLGLISRGTLSIAKNSGEGVSCLVASASASEALKAAVVGDVKISVELLSRDLEAAAGAINEKKVFSEDVSEDMLKACDIVFIDPAEMDAALSALTTTAPASDEAKGGDSDGAADEATDAAAQEEARAQSEESAASDAADEG